MRREVGCARKRVAPDLRPDRAAQAGLPELVGEASGEWWMDTQSPVAAKDAVLVEGIPAAFQPGGCEVVAGERRAAFLQDFEPQHLEIEIVVGRHSGREHLIMADLDPALLTLEACANR